MPLKRNAAGDIELYVPVLYVDNVRSKFTIELIVRHQLVLNVSLGIDLIGNLSPDVIDCKVVIDPAFQISSVPAVSLILTTLQIVCHCFVKTKCMEVCLIISITN